MLSRALISETRKFIRVPSSRVYGDLLIFLQDELGGVNVESEEESGVIIAKKAVIGPVRIKANIRILPEGEASAIKLDFSYRSFFLIMFASLGFMVVLCGVFLSVIPLFGIVLLIVLMQNLGSAAGSLMTSISEFLFLLEKSYTQEQRREARKRWQADSRSVEDLYERLLDTHTKIWGHARVLEYKISEYVSEGLTREEAIRRVADEEGIS